MVLLIILPIEDDIMNLSGWEPDLLQIEVIYHTPMPHMTIGGTKKRQLGHNNHSEHLT